MADEDANRVPELYANHLRTLRNRLPFRVRRFLEEINLHDGRVQDVAVDQVAHTLRLRIRAGDQQVGYYDADLLYLDATPEPQTVAVLEKMHREPGYDLLYDELDIVDSNQLVHRLMFFPEDEVSICFRDLSWQRTPRGNRSDASAV